MAGGNGNVDRLRTMIQKAQEQLLDAADTLDAAMVEASGVGGKIAQIIPPHVQAQIDKITSIIDGEDQSALTTLDELILNMPYRDLAPQSPSDRRAASNARINVQPNTAAGPQTAVKESILNSYRREERDYEGNGLSWNKLNESSQFSHDSNDEFGLSAFTEKPINTFQARQRIRETIESDDNEDLDHLEESMDGRGHFDWKAMGSAIGSIDARSMDFSSLKDTGKTGTDLTQISMIG
jgi:hypothetical protein